MNKKNQAHCDGSKASRPASGGWQGSPKACCPRSIGPAGCSDVMEMADDLHTAVCPSPSQKGWWVDDFRTWQLSCGAEEWKPPSLGIAHTASHMVE